MSLGYGGVGGQIEGYMRYSCKKWLIGGGAQLKLANGGSGGGGGGVVGERLEKRRKNVAQSVSEESRKRVE